MHMNDIIAPSLHPHFSSLLNYASLAHRVNRPVPLPLDRQPLESLLPQQPDVSYPSRFFSSPALPHS